MKKLIFFIFLTISFFATASKHSVINEKIYTDLMASYAALLGFDPIYGNVKGNLQSIEYVDDNIITKTFFISFNPNGCIESVKWRNIWIDDVFVDLKKIKNKLILLRGDVKEEFYSIDSDCKIIKNIKDNEDYIYNDNLISEVRSNGELLKGFEFNSKNELIKVVQYKNPAFSQTFKYVRNESKLIEVLMVVYMNDKLIKEKITCKKFDIYNNPLRCNSIREVDSENKEIKYIYITNYY